MTGTKQRRVPDAGRPTIRENGIGRPRPPGGRTRERLVRAAHEVLEDGGYAGASVLAIARRAGVSAGALYRHFPSKAALFVEVLRAAGNDQLAEMYLAAERVEDVATRLEAVVATYARSALHNRRLAWALVYEPVDPAVDRERLACRRTYCRGMAALLREGIAAGEFPDENADLTAAGLVGMIAETLVGPLSPVGDERLPKEGSEEEIVASLLRLCRRAVGVREVPGQRTDRSRTSRAR